MGVLSFYILFSVIAWPISDHLDLPVWWNICFQVSLMWSLLTIRDHLRMVSARVILQDLSRQSGDG